MRNDIELGGGLLRHPCRQMCQRAIALFDDESTLAPKSVFTNNTKPFAVARMKSIVNCYVE
jgi:hypothetical protein